MSLQLVLGRSGSGKSTYLYDRMIEESMKEEEGNFFLLVPEQFTMGTQREMILRHPNHGSFGIDVVSFLRLAYRIFDELGENVATVLEDQGKSMVLRKILGQLQSNLQIYHTMKDKPGFIDQLKSIFSEFYQYEINPNALKKQRESLDSDTILYSKLSDIILIYEAFESYMQDHFVVAEQLLDKLGDCVQQSQLLRDACIYIDGYTGFTPVQYQLLQRLLKVCKKVVITITIDERTSKQSSVKPFALFALGHTTMVRCKELAIEAGVDLEPDVMLGPDNPRFAKNEELLCLEQNLFQYPLTPYEKECEAFSIAEVANAREEIELVGAKIIQLVREKGYRYQEIVVLSADANGYPSFVEEIFRQLHIPYFIDGSVSIFNNPMVEAVRSVLELVVSDFSHEKMFRFLKTEMGPVTGENVAYLENYVIACGVKGVSRWKKPFVRKTRDFSEENLKLINALRSDIMDAIMPLREALSKKKVTVRDGAIALVNFMMDLQFEKKLSQYVEQFQKQEQFVLAKSYEQVYSSVLSLLDKLVEVLGEEELVPKEFVEILDAGFEQIDLGVIPSVLDKVLVGDLERSRFEHVKAIFVVGVNEGIIPKMDSSANLLGEEERRRLGENGLELAPDKIAKGYMDQFYLYFVLTKASEEIMITYHRVGSDGKALRPSYVIARIGQIYPKLQVKYYEQVPKNIRISFALSDQGEGSPYQAVVQGIQYEKQESYLSAELAKQLYGDTLYASVTRLETFAGCAYRHFLTYGLNLSERQEDTFAASDFGTLLHRVMEYVGLSMKQEKEQNGTTWQSISEEKILHILEDSIARSFACEDISLVDTARGRYVRNVVSRMAKRTVLTIHKQLEKSKMEPTRFEMEFPLKEQPDMTQYPLLNGCHMVLRGKVDRIDTYEEVDTVVVEGKPRKQRDIYLKVVDYKTGNQTLDYGKIYYGIQLQLLLYLDLSKQVIEKQYEKDSMVTDIHSEGAYYYHVDDPILDETPKQDVEQDLLKELQLRGITNVDEKELAINEEFDGKDYLVSVPVKKKKNGELYASDKNASSLELSKMTQYVQDKTEKLGNQIISGKTAAKPYRMDTHTGCDYCKMKGICQFEEGLFGQQFQETKKLKKTDFLEKIEEESKDE